MKDFPIPVRSIGPGSQPEEDVAVIGYDRDVPTFSMPHLPEGADAGAMAGARSLLTRFVDGMAGGGLPRIELVGTDEAVLEVLNQVLGEGEVRIRITASFNGTREVRAQETVFAGVWRERHYDAAGNVQHDWLMAAPAPPLVLEAAQCNAAAGLPREIAGQFSRNCPHVPPERPPCPERSETCPAARCSPPAPSPRRRPTRSRRCSSPRSTPRAAS